MGRKRGKECANGVQKGEGDVGRVDKGKRIGIWESGGGDRGK